jgi:alkanesulfonate monooxygenase SsuD/methylene tetrahydromethanopterin reductase-like flavin-dependent oxidoreductase (luciferase family)
MRTGIFLFGGVEMADAGAGPPASTDRRFGQDELWRATEQLLDLAVDCEGLGYDVFWLTEHHFQHEGYEVVPNGILFGATLAARTSRLGIGTMFNIVPQWHPLRLAEDFAYLHNISGGRALFGVGRGTVPREAEALGTRIGSFDNPDQAAADRLNREQFDEAIEVIRTAYADDCFSFAGRHYTFPPPGIPDRGGFVEHLTLVPRPRHPVEWWQAVTSPPTLDAAPRKGFGAVFWLKHHDVVREWWERYAELHATHHGPLQPGEKRMLVLAYRIGDTHEEAVASVRAGHDEFWKFLGPYGWSRGYRAPDGAAVPAGLIPTLEDSLANRTWLVGTAEDVAEGIEAYRRELGGLRELCLFPNMPGDPYGLTREQLARYAEEVRPLLSR